MTSLFVELGTITWNCAFHCTLPYFELPRMTLLRLVNAHGVPHIYNMTFSLGCLFLQNKMVCSVVLKFCLWDISHLNYFSSAVFSSLSLGLLPERSATLMVYDDVVQIVSGFQGMLIFESCNWNVNDISNKKGANLILLEL